MKRVLLDVNVMLDVLLDRQPHSEASAAVWSEVETGGAEGFLAAHAVATLHYLLAKEMGATRAKRAIVAILGVFRVAAIDSAVIREALELPGSDLEDAIAAVAARVAHCDYVVTRDPKGFRGSPVRPLTPEAVLPLLVEV
jgi:predicted nucleic acid-binding protein